MNTMTFDDAVWALLRRYKTHGEAARHMGINQAHYSQLRLGRVPMRPVVREGIIRCGEQAAKEIEAEQNEK